MLTIKILSEDLANKIAAGEVIERPASVVKELIENSLDAGSQSISLFTLNGGQDLLQVVDDGSGMSEEDARLCFERHATSKIRKIDDLWNLRTLGFRGEALASIGAVSRVELKTKNAENELGTLIRFEGGKISGVDKTAMNVGTSISVKNLFYNTPARRHFMKTASTEFRYILNTFKKFALSAAEIEFTLHNDEEKLFHLLPVSFEQRFEEVMDKNLNTHALKVSGEESGIKIDGYVGKPDFIRQARGDQFIFLNRRYLTNKTINHAVFSAYGTSIGKGDYPFYVLFIQIDPQAIDVNVHPAKMEVKFANEKSIYNFVHKSVKIALNVGSVIPALGGETSYRIPPAMPTFGQTGITLPKSTDNQYFLDHVNPAHPENHVPLPVKKFDSGQPLSELHTTPEIGIWQLHNKYILSQIKSGLVIIDQHVAHERVLFEKVLVHLNGREKNISQQLLFPQTLELSLEDWTVLNEISSYLSQIGFDVKHFSGRTIVIEAVPAEVRAGREGKILIEMIDSYKEQEIQGFDLKENIAASFACRNAVKAGDRLSPNEMHGLIDQLFATSSPYFCPHGRPVIITLPLEELDKKFLRT